MFAKETPVQSTCFEITETDESPRVYRANGEVARLHRDTRPTSTAEMLRNGTAGLDDVVLLDLHSYHPFARLRSHQLHALQQFIDGWMQPGVLEESGGELYWLCQSDPELGRTGRFMLRDSAAVLPVDDMLSHMLRTVAMDDVILLNIETRAPFPELRTHQARAFKRWQRGEDVSSCIVEDQSGLFWMSQSGASTQRTAQFAVRDPSAPEFFGQVSAAAASAMTIFNKAASTIHAEVTAVRTLAFAKSKDIVLLKPSGVPYPSVRPHQLKAFEEWQAGYDVSSCIQEDGGELFWLSQGDCGFERTGRFARFARHEPKCEAPRVQVYSRDSTFEQLCTSIQALLTTEIADIVLLMPNGVPYPKLRRHQQEAFLQWQRGEGEDMSEFLEEDDGELHWLAQSDAELGRTGKFASRMKVVPELVRSACPAARRPPPPCRPPPPPAAAGPAGVLVIVPGAGSNCNRAAYDACGYRVCHVGESRLDVPGEHYDRYPNDPEWAHTVSFPPPNLKTLAVDHVLGAIRDHRPCCIICGSRGGQVTVPELWRQGVDLPVVVINGGCISRYAHVQPPSPKHVILLTGGRDFFLTASPDYTRKYAPAPGIMLVHAESMTHMPSTNFLRAMLPLLIQAATSASLRKLKRGLSKHAATKFSNISVERL